MQRKYELQMVMSNLLDSVVTERSFINILLIVYQPFID